MLPQFISGQQTPAVLVAGVGVIGTLGGVGLGELLASLREKRRRRREHGRSLAQRYDAQYRSFLQSWSGAPSAEILRTAFATLRREAFVPDDLTVSVERVLAILDSSADAPKQREASQSLYQACLARLGSEAGLFPRRARRITIGRPDRIPWFALRRRSSIVLERSAEISPRQVISAVPSLPRRA